MEKTIATLLPFDLVCRSWVSIQWINY